jgi:diketogulonate reductase-like aldo/keto reductase
MNPKISLHNATILSILATSGCTAGCLVVAWVVREDIVIVSVQRDKCQRMSRNSAIGNCKTRYRRRQKVRDAVISKRVSTMQKGFAGDNIGVSREDVLLEIRNT